MDTIKAVWWTGDDSPLSHPAFKDAEMAGSGWVLPYPYWNPSLLKGAQAQEQYCSDKIRHLRSWGIKDAKIVDVAKPPKPGRAPVCPTASPEEIKAAQRHMPDPATFPYKRQKYVVDGNLDAILECRQFSFDVELTDRTKAIIRQELERAYYGGYHDGQASRPCRPQSQVTR